MDTIRHELELAVPVAAVFDAVATPVGQQAWWCKDSDIATHVGGECELRFNKDGNIVTMRFRIDELEPNARVRWTCIANPHALWIGSRLRWEITENGKTSTLTFAHDGLEGDGAPPEMISETWNHFMNSLKSYVEDGAGQPW